MNTRFVTRCQSLAFVLAMAITLNSAVASRCGADEPTTLTENTLALPEGTLGEASKIEDFAWLAGRWTGTGLGGEVEETWSPAHNKQMMGMFRFVSDGEIVFYELMTLTEVDGRLELKVKHFNADLTGWEEKDDFVRFRWISQAEGRFDFHGLSFRPSTDGKQLKIYLALHQNGEVTEASFDFQKQ